MTDLRKAAEDMLETLDKPFTASKTIFQAKEALRQALAQPAQECTCSAKDMPFGKCCKVLLKQKPVAWMYSLNDKVGEVAKTVVMERFNLSVTSPYGREGIDYAEGMVVKEFPVYTAPPKREWKGLTSDDKHFLLANAWNKEQAFDGFMEAIDKFLEEKNT